VRCKGACFTVVQTMSATDDQEIYRAVLESLPTGVYLVDRNGKILLWNDGAERITGHRRQDVLGRSSQDDFLCHADADNNEMTGTQTPLAGTLLEGKPSDRQISLQHKSGHRIPVRLRTVPVRNAHGHLVGAAECFEETMAVADWDRRQNKLAVYGCLDEASGTLNHAVVQSHLRESLATFAEHQVPFSILCIGIDRLEEVTARHGPAALAAVLRTVGQTLEHSLRPGDFLGRWNNNEFLSIVKECSATESLRVGERLRKMAHTTKIEWWGDRLPVTVAIGTTEAKASDTVETMVARAEKAWHDSMALGGNRVVVRNE
jgi:diguanylate cyclase (GGDEF)-like protein/PAS domain S-box-containing protein